MAMYKPSASFKQKQHFYKPGGFQKMVNLKWLNLAFQINKVPRRRFYCKYNGRLTSDVYTRVETDLKVGEKISLVYRWVREKHENQPLDPTAYQRQDFDGSLGKVIQKHWAYQGEAEKGRRYYPQITMIIPEGQRVPSVKVTTRYMDVWVE